MLGNVFGSLVTTLIGLLAGGGIALANKMQGNSDPLIYGLAGVVTVICALLKDPAFVKALVARLAKLFGVSAAVLLLFAGPARADGTAEGLIPALSWCNADKSTCLAPAATAVPFTLDLSTGNVGPAVLFQVGEGLTVIRNGLAFGADLLAGTGTQGGWNAAVMGKVGPAGSGFFKVGPVFIHTPGNLAVTLGFGAGY